MKLVKIRSTNAQYHQGITLSGLNAEETAQVKKSLTFDNPQYATTQRFSKYSYTTVPPFITYYKQDNGNITVPIGYDLSDLSIRSAEDLRVYEKVETPPFVLTLRGSQVEAVNNYLSHNLNNLTLKGSIELPTGKGKSILGLSLASSLSTKTLIVVHKDDLVTGWKKDIDLAFDGKVKSGLIKAKSRVVGDFITIATVQTLNKLPLEEREALYSQFGFVIQDEMHHCPATSFEVVSSFKARYKLGLTATPERADGLAHIMQMYFGDFCYRYKHTEEETDILPVEVVTKSLPFIFNPICQEFKHKNAKQYKVVELLYPRNKELSGTQKRLTEVPYNVRPRISFQTIDDIVVRGIKEDVCLDIKSEFNKGRSLVVFFTQKEHCRIYQEHLISLGVPEESTGLYYGDNKDNTSVIEKAEEVRNFITLTTYAKATEGTNVKQWEVEFLVSSLNNEKNVEQAVGRIRRTKEGCKLNTVVLYDYRAPNAYTLAKHGATRDARYRKLHFTFRGVQQRQAMFSRGYRK